MSQDDRAVPKLSHTRRAIMWDGKTHMSGVVELDNQQNEARGDHSVQLVLECNGIRLTYQTTMRYLHKFVGLLQLGEE